ncbi:MAG: phosphoribosylformylglycinamidine synthase I [bacterium]|nr:phosphoribosylformylglycinamidine synthase I [bacterium]
MFRVAILQFPGTNCEYETRRSINNAGLIGEFVRWNEREKLAAYDAYVLPGGFSYQDRSRAGIIATQDPVMKIIKEQANLGKPVIGICNGCQILIESGLVPGINNNSLAGAVAMNTRVKDGEIIGTGFYHDTVHIKNVAPANRSAITMNMDEGTIIPASVANAEGRFIFQGDLLMKLENNNQIILKYCTDDGMVLNEFPTNPNGALWGIAGVCNKRGNVVAYMPHPERMDTGVPIFASLLSYLERPPVYSEYKVDWQPPASKVDVYASPKECIQMYVDLIITDNEAKSVELALHQQGYKVKVSRKVHWEIWHSNNQDSKDEFVTKLVQSGEILNTNKEKFSLEHQKKAGTVSFLVRYGDDYEGKAVTNTLRDRFDMHAVENVRKAIVWELEIEALDDKVRMDIATKILQTYILYNPYSQECKLIK